MAEGREKEGELSCNYVSGIWTSVSICIDLSNDVIILDTCFSMFVYIGADWQKSDSSVEFKFQRRSWKECPQSWKYPNIGGQTFGEK